ncbi:hypothetical protein DM01DRAFT_1331019 [Hesseltinella vesiculosa]|uniref:Eukaryotic translation initiation factor 3 subunit M n=1 Tax=Hesseltinella vesiculosa TaxID=101127 RepID=A0A1X2GY20_9FUNG|nr:hypothetical protein DM01DRAFT_1331019 [Hesseltinella vesiculosa]
MASIVSVQSPLESQIDDLAFYISRLRGESEDDAAYVKEIQTLVDADKNKVFAKLASDTGILLTKNDRELEHGFNLAIVLVLSAPESELPGSVKALVDALTKTESTKISLKQKILLNLYNALPSSSPLRYDVFLGLLEVTSQADELDSLLPQLANIDTWTKQWGIDVATERQLYQNLADKLTQAGDKKSALDFLLKKLATFKDVDAESEANAKEVLVRAISLENYFAFEELLEYKAVQGIQGSKEYALLDLFLNGDLAKFEAFALDGLVDKEVGLRKIRLLSLASLGSENLARELTYSQISQALMIPEDEVEMWVIDVIRAGLVEAKLDQLNKTVIVHRSIYRVFGKEQWQQLSSRLNAWKDSLKDILQVIGNAKMISATHGATAGLDDAAVKSN